MLSAEGTLGLVTLSRVAPDARTFATTRARAVFLDRDGVLNRNVFYPDTQAYESPRTLEALELTSDVGVSLRRLRDAGFLLILVSNQPNAAKGKCSREVLDQIHAKLCMLLDAEGVALDLHFYCYHHPDHTGVCLCRKPSPYFLFEAAAARDVDLAASWMIGDRDSDIRCGQAAEVRTVWIDNREGEVSLHADLVASSIADAVHKLLAASHQDPAAGAE